jgi:hypothetical protein
MSYPGIGSDSIILEMGLRCVNFCWVCREDSCLYFCGVCCLGAGLWWRGRVEALVGVGGVWVDLFYG